MDLGVTRSSRVGGTIIFPDALLKPCGFPRSSEDSPQGMDKRCCAASAIGPQQIPPGVDFDQRARAAGVDGQIARFGQTSPELLRRSIRPVTPSRRSFWR